MEILEAITGISISLGGFAAVVLSIYFFVRARHLERVAMIEKGYQVPEKRTNGKRMYTLKFGIFFMGIAVGIFLGYIFAQYTAINAPVSFFSMILLFGGISLIFNFYLENKFNQQIK